MNWVKGNAVDAGVVSGLVGEADAVVHAIGLLFDANSGLTNLNLIVSGSGSTPDDTSTYDRITRQTGFNLINAIKGKLKMPFSAPTPMMFVSAAEAGWPDVSLGEAVENVAPAWLKEYLVAKRAVEAELRQSEDVIRAAIFRPSLIWSWTKHLGKEQHFELKVFFCFSKIEWKEVKGFDKMVNYTCSTCTGINMWPCCFGFVCVF